MIGRVQAWQLFDGESEVDPSNQQSHPTDQRLYPRYSLDDRANAFVELKSGERGIIKDLSYGGVSVVSEDEGFFRAVSDSLYEQKPISMRVEAFGKGMSCNLVPVFREVENVGLCFRHDTSEVLVFLKDIIRCLELGATLASQDKAYVEIDDEHELDEVSGAGLRAEILMEDGFNNPEQHGVRILWRDENIHFSVTLDRGVVITSQTIGMGGVLAPLTPTIRQDRRIMRGALFVLSGFCNILEERSLELIFDHLTHLIQAKKSKLPAAG